MGKLHSRGFSLLEILIVISIMLTLMGLLLGVIFNGVKTTNNNMAKVNLHTIGTCLTQYITDWDELPPFEAPTGYDEQGASPRAGSELLAHYLCKRFELGERSVGGYFTATPSNSVSTTDGKLALVSPLKGFYAFGFFGNKELKRRFQCIVVDPGSDKLLGGTVDNENGFTPDHSDANGDGKEDHLDNLTELVALR